MGFYLLKNTLSFRNIKMLLIDFTNDDQHIRHFRGRTEERNQRNQAKSSEIKQYLAKSSEIKQKITKKRSKSIGLGLHFTVGCPSCHKTSESYLNFTIDTLQNLA